MLNMATVAMLAGVESDLLRLIGGIGGMDTPLRLAASLVAGPIVGNPEAGD